MNLPAPLDIFCERAVPVGSRVTCNPAPMNTDDDVLVLLPQTAGTRFLTLMDAAGWELGGSEFEDESSRIESPFMSFTKGEVNAICTRDPVFYTRFLAATSVAKRLNLLNKNDRIMLFQAVLYGNRCDDGEIFDSTPSGVS